MGRWIAHVNTWVKIEKLHDSLLRKLIFVYLKYVILGSYSLEKKEQVRELYI